MRRIREITAAAQELVAERGWTQVTVEDIAARVGISRRTFFNHVDSKESAVLGSLPELTPDHLARLRGEGGEGTPFDDAIAVASAAVDGEGADLAAWRRLHDVLVANPALIPRLDERIGALSRTLVEHLAMRPEVTPEQARVVLAATQGMVQLSVEDALDRPELGTFAERIETNTALLRQLLSSR